MGRKGYTPGCFVKSEEVLWDQRDADLQFLGVRKLRGMSGLRVDLERG